MCLSVLLLASAVLPQVDGFEPIQRKSFAEGRSFGPAGAYEWIQAEIRLAVDPDHPANAGITDLALAPRNGDGLVEARFGIEVLQPEDPDKRSGLALIEVSNRGGRAAPYYLHLSNSKNPIGDGHFFAQGLTLIFLGWQFDVPPERSFLHLKAPVVVQSPKPITGWVRCDWVVDRLSDRLELGHRGHRPYAVWKQDSSRHRLTVRDSREGKRRPIPRPNWKFVGDPPKYIELDGGFQAGFIYELIYEGRDPSVVGLGLCALRDLAVWMKTEPESPFGCQKVVALGISQTGRFLRHFFYQGFNTGPNGRQALDGALVLTAGAGRGSFNHRFGQPSRDAHAYSAFFYPTDLFPFTTAEHLDPILKRRDGLFAHFQNPDHVPKVFFINTGYEYWGRAGALIHLDPAGKSDSLLHPKERIYHLAGNHHFAAGLDWVGQEPFNADQQIPSQAIHVRLIHRALTQRMLDWVQHDQEPPASRYPTLKNRQLVPIHQVAWPKMPDFQPPTQAHRAYRADYGPDWSQGIVSFQPPRLGPAFPTLVPQVDADGNEIGGLRALELRVPLGTYFPWKLRRHQRGSPGALADFLGSFLPFALKEREDDDRKPLKERFPSRESFRKALEKEAKAMIEEGFLLPNDLEIAVRHNLDLWDRLDPFDQSH
ncbi:MAG: hypothetical protein DWQ01_12455 [Planctomycetota bacterium]|nr:MAG: hypothetical protein DWQ01_12455 [Planctomycetota bacterium]